VSTYLRNKLAARTGGICLYGLAPPKLATPADRLAEIAASQQARLRALGPDGVIVYDIQDEANRASEPRPFPFLPTLDPESYAQQHLSLIAIDTIVYRSVTRHSATDFARWVEQRAADRSAISVLVGSPSKRQHGLSLDDAHSLVRAHAPGLFFGGIAIAERHSRRMDEHRRMLDKTRAGCRFFVTQAVYDVTSTKSLLSDYSLALAAGSEPPLPVIVTLSPCGSAKTLSFMQWLGISFPRWLENDLRYAADPLAISVELCERIFSELWEYARGKRIPLGINVESVSIRKIEIDASVELFQRLRRRIQLDPT
jgi:hypothetical protein